MPTSHELYELPFLAPVARGHEVIAATLRRAHDSDELASLVLDRSSGLVYCSEPLLEPLGRTELPLTDPIAVLTRFTWRVVRSTTGRSLGAVVSTTSVGDQNHARTRLFIEPEAAATYR